MARSPCGVLAEYASAKRSLALGVLRGLARLLQAGLLALLGPRVAGEEAAALELAAQLGVDLGQRPGDPVAHRPGLAADAAAVDADAVTDEPAAPAAENADPVSGTEAAEPIEVTPEADPMTTEEVAELNTSSTESAGTPADQPAETPSAAEPGTDEPTTDGRAQS